MKSPPREPIAAPLPEAPRFALAWAALAYAACTLTLAYPALAGRFLVNPRSDQFIAGFAFREFGARTLAETGGFPLWNPYLFGGMPYVAAMHGDIFYPTFLLRAVMPTDAAMTWSFIIHLFLAGLFTYLFLRAIGIRFHAALVGGAAYMMGGNVAGLVSPGHDGKLYLSALLPLTLLLLVRGIRDGRSWAWGALAITIGLAVLTPHPQLLQYLLLVGGAFALFLAFTDGGAGKLPRTTAMRRLGLALASITVGGFIGAIQYVPVMQYVDWSPRAGGKGWEHAVSYSMPPEELINTFLPQFSGILENYWGRNGIHFHSEYIGAVVLLLAGLSLGRSATVDRRFRWFWLGTAAVALLWALGGYTPFYHLVYALVPGTKFFRAPSTMLYVVSFATAVLAALGTERVLRGEVGLKPIGGWVLAGLLIALLAATSGLTNFAASVAPPERLDAVYANASALVGGAWRSFLFLALGAAILAAVASRRLAPSLAGAGLVALVALDLWSIERRYWQFSAPASELYAADPTILYMQRQPEPGRVLAIPSASRDPFLNGDALMSHRIRQVLGYHGNQLGRYNELMDLEGGGRQIMNPNFWQLANVQYLLTSSEDFTIPGAEKVVGPVTNAFGSTVSLYRLPGENPAAWVAPIIVKAPDEAVLATVLDPRFDVRRAALFDTSAKVQGESPTTLPPPLAIGARVTRFEPGRISILLSAPAPAGSALIVSENYYPGWRATVEGRPAITGRADMSLIGVALPAGGRAVELTFESAPYRTGKMITLVALALAVAAAGSGIAIDRRRRV